MRGRDSEKDCRNAKDQAHNIVNNLLMAVAFFCNEADFKGATTELKAAEVGLKRLKKHMSTVAKATMK